MALRDIITAPIKTITGNTITKLEDAVSAAEIEVERLERAASLEYLRTVQGDAPPGVSAKAQQALRDAQNELQAAQGALAEARRQHDLKIEEDDAADIEKRWRAVERLGKKRRDLAVEIDVAIENLANAVNELIDTSTAMHTQAPVTTVGVTHTKLSRGAIEGSLRLNLSKRGFAWAAKGNIFGHDNLPSVHDTIVQGNVETLAKKPTPDAEAA